MLFVVVLLSMLGTSRAQVNPQGPTINLEAVFLAGSTGYVQNTAANEFTTTDSVDSAAVFIADQDTGYLFQPTTDSINFPSGYSVPAVRTLGVVGLYEVSSYDAQTVVDGIGNGYYPLTCTGGLDLLSLVDLSVPVVCTDDGLTNLVTLFGTCPTLGNTIVDYGAVGLVQFLAQCGLLDDGQVITSFNAVFNAGNTIPGTPSTTGGGATVTPTQPGSTGTCSVTVSIIVTTTTSFVGAGYVGPSTTGSGGSTTGPNPYGCEPITSILGVF